MITALFCGLLASIGVATLQDGSLDFSDSFHSMKSAPEDIEFATGHITKFTPYFNTAVCNNPNGELRRRTPFASEGIEVTIEFENAKGKSESINETWMLPTFDHFKLGDSVEVFWVKALVAKPRSVIKDEQKLRHIAQNVEGNTGPEAALRETQLNKISQVWHEHALLFKQCDAYYAEYRRDPKAWSAKTVPYNYLSKTANAEYEDAAKQRLIYVRQQLETVSR